MPAGRKGKYNPEIVKLICESIEEGYTIAASAMRAGITTTTFHEWVNTKPDFSDAVQEATENYKSKLLFKLQYAASKDPKNWGAAAWILERRFRKEFSSGQVITNEFGEDNKLEVTVNIKRNNEGKS